MSDEIQKFSLTERNRKILLRHIHCDLILALGLVATTFAILPFSVLAAPFLIFLYRILTAERLRSDNERAIREGFPIPRGVVLRKSTRTESYVVAIPFFSIIYLTERVAKKHETDDTQAIIHHEIGHHGQYDWTIFVWIVSSVSAWIYMSLRSLVRLFQGGFAVYGGNSEHAEIIHATSTFWFASLCVISFSCVYLLRDVIHVREYFADTNAMQSAPDLTLQVAKRRADSERHRKPGNLFVKLINAFMHPTRAARYNALLDGIRPSPVRIFGSSTLWSFFCLHLALMCFVPSTVSYAGIELFSRRMFSVGTAMIVIFMMIGQVGQSIAQADSKQGGRPWLVLGYASGVSLAIALLLTLEYNVFDQDELANYPVLMKVFTIMAFAWTLAIWVVSALFERMRIKAAGLVGLLAVPIFVLAFVSLFPITQPEKYPLAGAVAGAPILFFVGLVILTGPIMLGVLLWRRIGSGKRKTTNQRFSM